MADAPNNALKPSANRTAVALERRQQQGQETRQRILEAALRQFAEHGFDGVAMRDIAAEAGIKHALINYHFESKEGLWREAVSHMFARLADEVTVPGAVPGDPAAYRTFIRRYVQYCARHPEHARLMVQESVRGGDRLRWAVEQYIEPGHRVLAPFTLAQVEAGRLPAIWPWSLVYIIVAMCQAPFMLGGEFAALTGLDPTDERVVEAHADAVIAALSATGPKATRRAGPRHRLGCDRSAARSADRVRP